MRRMAWKPLPCDWVRDGRIKALGWSSRARVSRAEATASLMVFLALVTHSDVREGNGRGLPNHLEVDLTYNALMVITGLSKALVSAGLKALEELGLIQTVREGRKNLYLLEGFQAGSWVKLPSRALFQGRVIEAFSVFTKRSKVELYALKLYLYLASARSAQLFYSMSTYMRIHEVTGIPMEDIARAISFLESCGLLARVERGQVEGSSKKDPNRYYLTGYRDLRL